MVREERRGRLESEDKTRKEIRKRRQMEGGEMRGRRYSKDE